MRTITLYPFRDHLAGNCDGRRREVLRKALRVERSASLYYQVTLDNNLATTVDIKRPRRGNSAFQTDLCIFEENTATVSIKGSVGRSIRLRGTTLQLLAAVPIELPGSALGAQNPFRTP